MLVCRDTSDLMPIQDLRHKIAFAHVLLLGFSKETTQLSCYFLNRILLDKLEYNSISNWQ